MPEGGRLAVTLAPARDRWRIRFADTGRGLTPQQLEKVFEPFQSEFEGGTGLGLAIAYEILQAHDARVSVHSSPGEGIEFSIDLKQAPPGRGPALPMLVAHANPPSFKVGSVLEAPSGVKNG